MVGTTCNRENVQQKARDVTNSVKLQNLAHVKSFRLLEDDVVFRCTVGPFAVAAVRATRAVENARGRWAWDASQARFWGAHAAATTLAASFLSGEERVRARLALPPPKPAISWLPPLSA